ncbi:uncharacterized protein DNG_09207 [Cephalotrichum gorgonifer]|uniref:Uncharacterized protein n=1 Tax=Cephalotrichum gorgonifer TaxID=2041049 RepID=A0AAE8N5E5_9PEZI|nr:uncharacterized protein DNG_09207 [Cephalotrichum gorgonifer]
MKAASPKLIITALVAGFLATGTFAFPLHPESAIANAEHKWLTARAPPGVRPPKHSPDSDSEFSEPDPKRLDGGSSGSDSGESSGAVTGPVWGSSNPDPVNQPPPVVQDPPTGHFGGTVGSIPISQADIPQQATTNPNLVTIEQRGGRNVDSINGAKTRNDPVNNNGYDEKFSQFYFRKQEANPNANVSPEVDAWLKQNGIDLAAPDVVKVRVFGKPFDPDAPDSPPRQGSPSRDSDSESDSDGYDSSYSHNPDDTSIMEAYMSPSGGWMYRTRMFRSREYDNFYDLSYEERLPISEIMNRQWKEVAGNDAPLTKVVGANVEADDTVQLLRDLQLTTGRNEGTIDPSDPARFNQALGSSQGNVVAFMLKDHHSEPIAGTGVPTSVSWRYTGGNALDAGNNPTEYADSFLLVNIG